MKVSVLQLLQPPQDSCTNIITAEYFIENKLEN